MSLNFRCMAIASVVYLNTRVEILSDYAFVDIVKEAKKFCIRVSILKVNIFSLVYTYAHTHTHLENYNRSV